MKEPDLNDRRDASVLDKLSARTRATINALIRSPLADLAMAEIESNSLDERRALIAELAALDKRQPEEIRPLQVEQMRAHQAPDPARQIIAWRGAGGGDRLADDAVGQML